MEEDLVREQVKRLVSLSMWVSLQEGRRELEFRLVPKWRKYWKLILKRDGKNPADAEKLDLERRFLHRLMLRFIDILREIKPDRRFNSFFSSL